MHCSMSVMYCVTWHAINILVLFFFRWERVPSLRTRIRTTTMPATAWCYTWSQEMRSTSSWTAAKRTEGTTTNTARSLGSWFTQINTWQDLVLAWKLTCPVFHSETSEWKEALRTNAATSCNYSVHLWLKVIVPNAGQDGYHGHDSVTCEIL